MSLPWLRDDYERPESRSRSKSRSRSGSKGRRDSEDGRNRRSRSRSKSSHKTLDSRNYSSRGGGRGGGRGRGGRRDGGGRSPERSRRKRSRSSSSGSSDSRNSPATRLVASTKQKYVSARIFVANLSSKELSKNEIVAHFEKYGNVVDCLIHPKNYVFVQYLKEEHARLAVEGENGSTFNGFRIHVKMANEKNKASQPQGRDEGGPGPRDRERPPRGEGRGHGPYGPDPFIHDRRGPPPPFPPPPGDYGMRDHYYPPDPFRRGYPPDPWMPPDDPYRRDPYVDPYRDPYVPRLPPPVPVGPVECEVFIVNSQLRTYGEMIERRVKDQSILTALSIIPEGRKAPQMVEDLTAKGGLFAIFLNPQNEIHRSLTLNILHGTPQEHRNMPLDDAIGLVGRSFEKYVEELRAKANSASAAPPPAAGVPSSSRVFLPPSSEVTYLLNLLADNRALTVAELDSVIKYLKERRDKLIDADKRPLASEDDNRSERSFKEEKSDSGDSGQKSKGKESKDKKDENQATHEELTKKILSIFQGVDPSIAAKLTSASTSAAQVPAPAPAPPPPPPKSSASSSSSANLINFDNPNVQKALDNLIQSGPNLLKTFTSKSSNSSTTSTSGATSIQVNPAPQLPGDDDNLGMHEKGRGSRMMEEGRGMREDGQGMMGDGMDPGMMQAQAMGMVHPNMGMDMQMYAQQQQQQQQFAMDMNQALTTAFNFHALGQMSQMGGMMGQMDGPMGQMEGSMGPMGGPMGPMGGPMGPMGGPDFNRGGAPPPPPPNQRF